MKPLELKLNEIDESYASLIRTKQLNPQAIRLKVEDALCDVMYFEGFCNLQEDSNGKLITANYGSLVVGKSVVLHKGKDIHELIYLETINNAESRGTELVSRQMCKGLGRRLVSRSIEEVKKVGAHTLEILSMRTAIPFYESVLSQQIQNNRIQGYRLTNANFSVIL